MHFVVMGVDGILGRPMQNLHWLRKDISNRPLGPVYIY
jgi:hypothetical protein